MCCLRCVRFDIQFGDSDVKEVHMKKKRVQDCAVEALILRKKPVKILSFCKNTYVVKVFYNEEARTCNIAVGIVCMKYRVWMQRR